MKTIVFVAAMIAASPALAGGPTQGTYAGQTTRGAMVNANIDTKNTTPGGYGAAVSAQAHDGGRGDKVNEQLDRPDVVGGGK